MGVGGLFLSLLDTLSYLIYDMFSFYSYRSESRDKDG